MIVKLYQLNNFKTESYNFFLFYGKNEGAKNDEILKISKKHPDKKIFRYDEKEILNDLEKFYTSILNGSLFEKGKIIIINKITEKSLNFLLEFEEKKFKEIIFILKSDNLEKRSKLRSIFEKNNSYICIPVYQDDDKTLMSLAKNYFIQKKILMSQSNLNLIVNKSNGDRQNLKNELEKIELFHLNNKNITTQSIIKLINLNENHDISTLIDNCLAKNQKKTFYILNENIFSTEDSVLIVRIFLIKAKRALKLSNEMKLKPNLEELINTSKPPIFWKDKELIKNQIIKNTNEELKKIIFDLNNLELLIKKNIDISIKIITDFILKVSTTNSNNSFLKSQ